VELGSSMTGIGNTIWKIAAFEGALQATTALRVQEAADVLEKEVKFNISATCHSLKALAKLGHPYSVMNPHNPHPERPWLVHTQTHRLLGSIRKGFKRTGFRLMSWIGIDETKATGCPYARAVLFGTPRMIGRDFMGESLKIVRPMFPDLVASGFEEAKKWAIITDLYKAARLMKWISKVLPGATAVTSKMYNAARVGRTAEVFCNGKYLGISKRMYHKVITGPIVGGLMIKGVEPKMATALVNAKISRAASSYLMR